MKINRFIGFLLFGIRGDVLLFGVVAKKYLIFNNKAEIYISGSDKSGLLVIYVNHGYVDTFEHDHMGMALYEKTSANH